MPSYAGTVAQCVAFQSMACIKEVRSWSRARRRPGSAVREGGPCTQCPRHRHIPSGHNTRHDPRVIHTLCSLLRCCSVDMVRCGGMRCLPTRHLRLWSARSGCAAHAEWAQDTRHALLLHDSGAHTNPADQPHGSACRSRIRHSNTIAPLVSSEEMVFMINAPRYVMDRVCVCYGSQCIVSRLYVLYL